MWVSFRRRNMTVLRNSLARCNARHLRIKHLVQFILVDPVCNNALTNRAALLCRALRRVNRLCSSTVSGTANMSRHGSTLCSPTVEEILCRSSIVSVLPSPPCPQGKGVIHKRVETAGVYPLVRPRGVSALPPPRDAANFRAPQSAALRLISGKNLSSQSKTCFI